MSIDDQNNHPLYKNAHERFLRAEMEQNIKAATKYPGPLNPDEWTAEALGDHFAQEAVDQGRYVEAIVAKCKALESENMKMRRTLVKCRGVFLILMESAPLLKPSMQSSVTMINETLGQGGTNHDR